MASNAKFHRIEELKLVRGFEGKKYDLIAPYISALPENTKVNINTASPLVLASIDQKLDLGTIEKELQLRQQNLKFFQNIDELWQLSAFQQLMRKRKLKLVVFRCEVELFKHKLRLC